MKHLLVRIALSFTALFLSVIPAKSQQFNWVKGGGTNAASSYLTDKPEGTYFTCTDYNGNVYALNTVGNAAIHADTFYRSTAYGSDANILLTSYNCSGQMRFAKLIGSTGGECEPYGIVTDSTGHIYIAGLLTAHGLRIGYDTTITGLLYDVEGLIQFDTSGHFNWIRYVGDNTSSTLTGALSIGSTLAMDAANNVHFFNSMKYGVHITPTLTSHLGTYDLTYNSSGTLLNVKKLQLDSTLEVYSATIDKQSGKVYASGYRISSFWTDYGGDSSYHCYLAEFDTARNQVWMDTLGDPASPEDCGFVSIAADGIGNLYVAGSANGNLLYKGETIYPPTGAVGGYISFIMKTDTAGNKEWIKQCDGNSNPQFYKLTLVPGNKVAGVGIFNELANCGTITISAGVGQDPFLMVVDTSGTLETLQRLHGDAFYDWGYSIASDRVGNLYIGGSVGDTIPDTLIPSYHSVGGNTDFFILKYGVDCACTAMPVAAYSSAGTSTVIVTYTGTTAGLDSVKWNFGDGTSALGATATHAYTVVGTVDLCVTVYTSCGYDIYCHDITVNCAGGPVSAYTDTGTTVRGFTYTGTTAGLDSVRWSFGDGHTGTGTTPIHTYSASGTYTVCATAYTGCGSNTYCNTIVVNCTPTASFTDTGTTTRGFTYTGTTISLDSVKWNFGDGYTALGNTSIHTYSASGTYTVCVTVYTACGSNTACSTVVINCTPVSSYTYSGSAPVSFTYTGTTSGLDSVVWNFGDGSATSTGVSSSHVYTASGTYTVCATAYAPCGSNTYCSSVIVNCSPTSSFTDTGTIAIGFNYTGTTASVDSIVWDFGDGNTATGTAPLHTYTATGTYTVCATVYTICGNNTACNTVVINCTPATSFTDTGSSIIGFTYTGSIAGVDSVKWTFGDGSTSSSINPTHTYTSSGTYTVCVTVYTSCGSDSACANVIVLPTGINTIPVSNINVYPNPANDELFITGILATTAYRLLNVTGVSMIHGSLHTGDNTVSMNGFSPGIYMLEMIGVNGEKNFFKVVKE